MFPEHFARDVGEERQRGGETTMAEGRREAAEVLLNGG